MKVNSERKIVATNRKFFHDYNSLEQYEAGLMLAGSEVKSLRDSKASLQDSFARVEKGEMFVYNLHVNPYSFSGHTSLEPKRKRKLLLHKKEIDKLFGKTTQKGFLLIPVEIYFNKDGLAKMTLALATRKKGPDKREMLKERDIERELRRDNSLKRR
ncbi:MAG: SsrA-binding protein [Elusimicrobia bacterium RIFOXYA2_FULL_40_6]|nr:MAG: SsrA-binding protein [Elusimicrobia bacterium RIFOXYA2_FULL_40_6]